MEEPNELETVLTSLNNIALQEVVAPSRLEFWSRHGFLGTKQDLSALLCHITGIDPATSSISMPDHSTRLDWVADRATKMPEDKVYCMMGICEVSIDVRYGEGETLARRRLEGAIREH